ncbi:MAG: ABC transporter substrate-binding protein [Lachnospiraceae bacterium]|nr:ABC transporter substrate-binding protein [Lachnospiraceae bacterium]
MKKKILGLMLASLMVVATACSSTDNTADNGNTDVVEQTVDEETTEDRQTQENDDAEEQDGSEEESNNDVDYTVTYPVTIVDQAGREVTIAEEPTKLVSGYYISSSLLIALDLDSKMVGVEAKADKRPIYKLSAPELMELPNVGSAKNFDLEGCIALEPDLVILPLKLKESAAALEELGINVILVNPENQELFLEMADIIATATNTVERKNSLVDFINAQDAMIDSAMANADGVKVYLAGNSDFLSTACNGMYQSDMISNAGGINVAGEIEDTYWVETDYEQVLAWNPEYIIIAAEAEYSVEDVLNDENLAMCDAVINGNVYKIPSKAEAWDSPVPGGILGSVWLGSVIHPELISAEQCDSIIEEFYETFYDFKYSEN